MNSHICYFLIILFLMSTTITASLQNIDEQDFLLSSDEYKMDISAEGGSGNGDLSSDDNLADLDAVDDNDDNIYEESNGKLNKENFLHKYMLAATRAPEVSQQLGQVLPILRSMSPPQRLAFAALFTLQMMSSPNSAFSTLDQVTAMFGVHPNEGDDKKKNMSSELLLPISLDIANILRGAISARSLNDSPQALELRSLRFAPGTRRKTYFMPHSVSKGHRHRTRIPSGHNRRNVHVQTEMIPPPPPQGPSRSSGSQHHKGRRPAAPHAFPVPHSLPSREKMPNTIKDISYHPKKGDLSTMQPPDTECEYFTNTLCLEVSNYPNDAIIASIKKSQGTIEALLADFKQLATDFSIENDIVHQKRKYSIEKSFSVRRQDENVLLEGGLCPSSVKFARPKRARTTNGHWKYIVNTGDYTQTLRLEMCLYPAEACSYVSEQFRSQCTQVYNYHRLLTWDDIKGLHMDIFKVPTCCSCHVSGYSVPFPPRDIVAVHDPNKQEHFPGTDFAADDHRRPFPHKENRVPQHNFENQNFRNPSQNAHNNEQVNIDAQRTPFPDHQGDIQREPFPNHSVDLQRNQFPSHSQGEQFVNGPPFHGPPQPENERNRIPDHGSVNVFVTPGHHVDNSFRNPNPEPPPFQNFGSQTPAPQTEQGVVNQFPAHQDHGFRNEFTNEHINHFQEHGADPNLRNQFHDSGFGHFDSKQGVHVTPSSQPIEPPFHRQGFRRPTSDDLVPPLAPPLPLAHESDVQSFAGNQIRRSRNQTSGNFGEDSDLEVGESTVNRRPFPNTITSDSIRRSTSTVRPITTTKVPTTTITSLGKKVNYNYHPIIDYFKPQTERGEEPRSRQDWTPILTNKKSQANKSEKT